VQQNSSVVNIQIKTRGFNDTHDLTPRVEEFPPTPKISDGIVIQVAGE